MVYLAKKSTEMKIKILVFYPIFILSILFLAVSCEESSHNNLDDIDDVELNDDTSGVDSEHVDRVTKIFYNIPSPIEMATIMQQAGATYNSEILNSVDNLEKYTTIATSALNLGVYGADLSYTRMFDQIQESVNYLSVLRKLSDRLGIPQDEGSFAVGRIEENIDNRDSLLMIISETYANADTYLKENDRESTAALIIMGGWIEALYVSASIINEDNQDDIIMKRIAEQKYSLQNLIELLNIYKDDQDIAEYIPKLDDLKLSFEKIEIIKSGAEVKTDTVNQVTSIGGDTQVNVTFEHIKEIKDKVGKIRTEIIS
ncbi:MAG: hypothetical protein C0594_12335 [Marinilabiliales bacterium]|nr:MAG: hypothetical protein C0594_12335 [Marinilabiliales bacterium]